MVGISGEHSLELEGDMDFVIALEGWISFRPKVDSDLQTQINSHVGAVRANDPTAAAAVAAIN